MKSSEEVSPSAPWNQGSVTAPQPPSYTEAINSGAPYPMQMPQPQPMPPYPVQQQSPYPIAQEIPIHSQLNPEIVQQHQTPQYTAVPIVNHPSTHVQHIVTVVPQQQLRGWRERNRGIILILSILFGLLVLGAILRGLARAY